MRQFSPVDTADLALQKAQDGIAKTLNPLASLPLVDGALLEAVSLKSGQDNPVSHGLGRRPRLWILAGKNANADVWEQASPAPTRFLNLRCSADCTVNLWVA